MLGDRIKLLRNEQGMTQEQLGDYLNLSSSSVKAYENRGVEPSLSVLVKLADVFNVSLDYLLERTEEKHNINLMDYDNKELILKLCDVVNDYKIIKK